ncbi:MAG TPA: DUF1566 domain-containing protein [Candidatus Binatia bacterium]|jgi:hypothetical protein
MKYLYTVLGAIVIAFCTEQLMVRESLGQSTVDGPPWGRDIPADSRFVLIFNTAAVLDRETDLIWERKPDPFPRTWFDAQALCNTRILGNRMGWRLPRIQELASLVNTSNADPALPDVHPFLDVASTIGYWSATSSATDINSAWIMTFSGAGAFFAGGGALPTPADRNTSKGVWCVRTDIPGTDAQ